MGIKGTKWGVRVKSICLFCGNELIELPCIAKKRKYCSNNCLTYSQRKRTKRKCISCGTIYSCQPANPKKHCSRSCYIKTMKIPWNKGIPNYKGRGANCHLWKGGITSVNNKIRSSIEYTLWRTAVFVRDNYTCQKCFHRGGNMEADHIKPFAYYPELRFAIDNGRTLCKTCHRKTETYGRRIYG